MPLDPSYIYLAGWCPAVPTAYGGWELGHVEALVDVEAYVDEPGPVWRWCRFEHIAPGTASVYPFKLAVPGRGQGQFKNDEIRMWRIKRESLDTMQIVLEASEGDRVGPWPT